MQQQMCVLLPFLKNDEAPQLDNLFSVNVRSTFTVAALDYNGTVRT
jgi:hypothetical protein